ncbi:MAG: hypothetical protein JW699_08210 [Chitinispirillaceae bacterium]|nr:hypothetical protein [Chitinispirillaceae bacterium]
MSSVMIAEYLDENEASRLRERLKAEDIAPVVKRHGLPRMFGVDSNYRIFIDRTHAGKGKAIVERFLIECAEKRAENKKRLTKQCPRCRSSCVMNREKTSLWLKVRFFGVSVWQCSECGNEWYT